MKYIASCSGGIDSTCSGILALENGEPLDEVLYCEVIFGRDIWISGVHYDEISGEVPEHLEFVLGKLRPFFELQGVRFTHLKSKKTYLDSFYHTKVKGRHIGKYNGFAFPRRCEIQRDCKKPPIYAYFKTLGDVTQYIGIEKDETDRLMRMCGTNKVSLLEKYGYTRGMAYNKCQEYGLISPAYNWANRNGCWFCPNIKDREIGHLMIEHPHLWQALLDLEQTPDIVGRRLTYDETASEIDTRLTMYGVKMSIDEILYFMQTKQIGK